MTQSLGQVLQLLVVTVVLASTSVHAKGILIEDIFTADMSLAAKSKSRKAGPNEVVGPVPTGVAWDGSNFWTAAGGNNDTVNLLKWCKKGTCVQEYDVPHLDIRSIWTQGEGKDTVLYADVFSDQHVYIHKDHGHFELTNVTLHGATKDVDSPVLYRLASLADDPKEGVLVAHDDAGSLLEFDAATGAYLRSVPFKDFGSEPGETDWPNYVRFAIAQVDSQRFFYLTYAGGHLHAWDHEGKRVGSATLQDAGDDEMSCHSLSYARERVWVRDSTTETWHGYKLSFAAAPPSPNLELSGVYDEYIAPAQPEPEADLTASLTASLDGESCPFVAE